MEDIGSVGETKALPEKLNRDESDSTGVADENRPLSEIDSVVEVEGHTVAVFVKVSITEAVYKRVIDDWVLAEVAAVNDGGREGV
jgi:hypothetical protein